MIDFSQLDKTIHEKGRLSIMTLLAARASWSFQDLKAELKMSDGNLSTHLRTLLNAKLVDETREITTRTHTFYSLTRAGRRAFEKYLAILEAIVRSVKN